MNDGQYTNMRNYLEEIAGNQKEILAELRRLNQAMQSVAITDKPIMTKAITTTTKKGK